MERHHEGLPTEYVMSLFLFHNSIRQELCQLDKKFKINLPMKKETTNIINTLIEAQNAILFFSSLESSWVKPRKIGTVPNGLITENSAANVSKNRSISKKGFS